MKQYSTPILVIAVLTIVIAGNYIFNRPFDAAHAVEATTSQGINAMPINNTLMIKESTDGASMNTKSEYALPYPGILPDHPLYFLKDFRDKIIEMLIVDPVRKSEFHLLQSDKFLSAAVSLLDKNQTDKAKMMLSLSSTKMTTAVSELSGVKTNGGQVTAGSVDRIQKSIEKHQQVLTDLSAKIDVTEASSSLQKALTDVATLK